VSGHIKDVSVSGDDIFDRFSGKNESCVLFGYGGSNTHFLEGRIDLSNRQVALNDIVQPSQPPQSGAIVAIDKSVDRNPWDLPVLEITEVVKSGQPGRVEVVSFQTLLMLAQRSANRAWRPDSIEPRVTLPVKLLKIRLCTNRSILTGLQRSMELQHEVSSHCGRMHMRSRFALGSCCHLWHVIYRAPRSLDDGRS
jgi:hypothetical protein